MGVDWITALRSGALRTLIEAEAIAVAPEDQDQVFELLQPAYPEERVIAC